jgi:hypothetical protein
MLASFLLAAKLRDTELDFQDPGCSEADIAKALVQAFLVGLVFGGWQFQGERFLAWWPHDMRDAEKRDLGPGASRVDLEFPF